MNLADATPRQRQVLRTLIRCGSRKAAAYELRLSDHTVRNHLHGLYQRTGCRNAYEAAFYLGLERRSE